MALSMSGIVASTSVKRAEPTPPGLAAIGMERTAVSSSAANTRGERLSMDDSLGNDAMMARYGTREEVAHHASSKRRTARVARDRRNVQGNRRIASPRAGGHARATTGLCDEPEKATGQELLRFPTWVRGC